MVNCLGIWLAIKEKKRIETVVMCLNLVKLCTINNCNCDKNGFEFMYLSVMILSI